MPEEANFWKYRFQWHSFVFNCHLSALQPPGAEVVKDSLLFSERRPWAKEEIWDVQKEMEDPAATREDVWLLWIQQNSDI